MKRATTKSQVLNFSTIPSRVPPLPKLLPADSYAFENKDKHIIFDLTTTTLGGCDEIKPSSTCQTESSEIKLVSPSSLDNLRPQIVLVYLHGANQNPINEIIFRLVNSYYEIIKQEKQLLKFKLDIVHSAIHRDAQAVVQHYISQNHIVFIGGHSAGSGVAARLTIQPELTQSNEIKSYLSAQHQVSSVSPEDGLAVSKNDDENKNQSSASSSATTTKAIQQQQLKNNIINNSNQQQHRLPCILLGTSAPSFPQGVYGLCVLGELDGDGKSYVKNKDRTKSNTNTDYKDEKWKSMMNIFKAGNGTAALVVPFNADHSLRIPTKSNPTDKDASTMSEETKMMSLELARKIHEFVVAYCFQQPLPFF